MLQLPSRLVRLFLACFALIIPCVSRAAEPAQFIHASWTSKDGVPGMIQALAQTQDGYLWLGSYEGLFRFDGVSFEHIEPAAGHPDGAVPVSALHVMRNGELWVGYAGSGGVEILKGNRLVKAGMPDPPGEVTGLAEDADGGVWAIGGRDRGTLQRFFKKRWRRIGTDWGVPDEPVSAVYPAADGTIWLATVGKVLFLRAGARHFVETPAHVANGASFAQDGEGRLWLADLSGTRMIPDFSRGERTAANRVFYPALAPVRRTMPMFDRDGALWSTTYTGGIFRIPRPGLTPPNMTMHYRVPQGLTSNEAVAVLQDREGNVWVGTEMGLDQFRRPRVERVALPPRSSAFGYVATADERGNIYIVAGPTLYRSHAGGEPRPWISGLDQPRAMCRAAAGFWLAVRGQMLRLEQGRVVRRLRLPDDAPVSGCAEDASGRLWLAIPSRGVLARFSGSWKVVDLPPGSGEPQDIVLGQNGLPMAFVSRRELIGLNSERPLRLGVKAIGVAGLTSVTAIRQGTLIGGGTGLALWTNGHLRRLSVKDYPWLRGIRGVVQTAGGELWMINNRGILRVLASQLISAFSNPRLPVRHELLGELDGLASRPQGSSGTQAIEGDDGSIWFLTRQGVTRVRPEQLRPNLLAPPVFIRSLDVDGKRISDPFIAELAPGTRNLSIAYTALSLSVPTRVHFRYRLDGVDSRWIDPEGRRQAFYTNLGPGTYRFRVIAANEDGVWNRQGAVLQFTIPPTFVQSRLFVGLCLLSIAALLWAAYALRLRALTKNMQSRLAERLAERERIAGDLHDTLLQSVQALILRFSVATNAVREPKMRESLVQTLDRAEDLLIEARDRVSDLREATVGLCLEDLIHETVRNQHFPPSVSVTVNRRGRVRQIEPSLRDHIAVIAGEALFNANRHSGASRIDLDLVFRWNQTTLCVRDNGTGIDPAILATGGREGHFGLASMRERARRIGARLTIEARPGAGTAVILKVPRLSPVIRWNGRSK